MLRVLWRVERNVNWNATVERGVAYVLYVKCIRDDSMSKDTGLVSMGTHTWSKKGSNKITSSPSLKKASSNA